MLPEPSVSKVPAPVQLKRVDIFNPPATESPPAKVLVAELVCNMLPPEIVRPEAEESPPVVSILIPPANVEVAVEEELMPPPSWRRPETFNLFEKVEEAEELNPANVE